jgi:predicted metal-dependent hydrolase
MGEVIRLDDPAVLVRLHRSPRARRFTLSLKPGATEARLTAPAAARDWETRQFLARQTEWLRGALDRAPPAVAVADGVRLPVDGRLVTVAAVARPRTPCRLEGEALIAPAAAPGPAVAAFLKLRAQGAIAPAARRAAAILGRGVGRISFRDTRSRWGSCTAKGDLAFSWRLAMAPPEVRDYVAVHEAAHLVEMNHGPGFWRLVAELRPDFRVQRAWLRREGAGLHGYRF